MASSGDEVPAFAPDEDCTAFMKAGGCGSAYVMFKACLALAACCNGMGSDEKELCREVALDLKKSMDENADHYAPLLRGLPPGAGEGKKE